jgi:hypothetical protein
MAIEGFAAADRALSPFSPCCSQPRASRFVFRVPAKREFPLSARSPRSRERRSAMRAADTGDAGRFPRRWWPGMGSALAPRGYARTRGRACEGRTQEGVCRGALRLNPCNARSCALPAAAQFHRSRSLGCLVRDIRRVFGVSQGGFSAIPAKGSEGR